MTSALFRFSLDDRLGSFAFSVPRFGEIESARRAFSSALRYRRTLLKLNLGQALPLIMRAYGRFSTEIIQIENLENLQARRYDFDYEISMKGRVPWLHITSAPDSQTVLTMAIYAWLGRENYSNRFGRTPLDRRRQSSRAALRGSRQTDPNLLMLSGELGNPIPGEEPYIETEEDYANRGYRSRAEGQRRLREQLERNPLPIPHLKRPRRIRVDFSDLLPPGSEDE